MTTLRSLDVDVEVQPLKQWPDGYERRPEEERQTSLFEEKGILERTVTDLGRELRLLSARDVVIQCDIPQGRIRQDGLPYQNAQIGNQDPGVVLTFETDEGVQTYPCDTYRQWTENLRAIAKTLKRLRDVARYGVGQGSEQYRGFTALPENVDDRLGPEEAARVLASTAPEASQDVAGGDRDRAVEAILEDREVAGLFYREAAKRSHPDRPDVAGDAHFKRVQRASHVLEQHFSAGGRKTVGAGREADGG